MDGRTSEPFAPPAEVSPNQRPLPLEDADASIAGRPPAFYFRKARPFIIIGVLVDVILFFFRQPMWTTWAILAVVPSLPAILFAIRGLPTGAVAAVAGAAGLGIGCISALIQIVWFRQVWTVFNGITEPLLGLFSASLVGALIGFIFRGFVKRGGR